MKLFGEKGYDGTALSEIAKEVGVKTPAIYAFYENKEDLFMTVFRDAMQSYNQFIQHLSDEQQVRSTRDNLYGILTRQYEYYRESQEISLFALRYLLFPPPFLKETIEQAFLQSDKLLSEIIQGVMAQGLQKGEIREQPIELLADSFLNLMDGLCMQYFYYSSKEVYERKLNNAFEMYWNGARS